MMVVGRSIEVLEMQGQKVVEVSAVVVEYSALLVEFVVLEQEDGLEWWTWELGMTLEYQVELDGHWRHLVLLV